MREVEIELLGAPILRQKAVEVAEVDDELRRLIQGMFRAMYRAEGIGLAANQVGIAKRVIVVDIKDEDHPAFALVNPTIVALGGEPEKAEEGCLSIPGVSALVERPTTAVVEGLDVDGNPVRMEANALLARCLQHEVDHLEGVLFIDHLSALKRSMLLKKYRSLAAEEAGTATGKPRAHRSG